MGSHDDLRLDIRGFNVLVRPSNLFDVLAVFFGVSEIDKLLIAAVGTFRASRVFDWTPVLFSPGGDLGEVGENAVAICALFAIQLLDKIQVAQVMAV